MERREPSRLLLAGAIAFAYRVIRLDGAHPPSGVRLWNGDSRGRWEGNTLVVDVTNFLADPAEFNMQPWFDPGRAAKARGETGIHTHAPK